MAKIIARVLILAISAAKVVGAPLDSTRTAAARALLPTLPSEIRGHADRYLTARDTAARHLEAGRLSCNRETGEFVLPVVPAEPVPSFWKGVFIPIQIPRAADRVH